MSLHSPARPGSALSASGTTRPGLSSTAPDPATLGASASPRLSWRACKNVSVTLLPAAFLRLPLPLQLSAMALLIPPFRNSAGASCAATRVQRRLSPSAA
eukprot:8882937-Alexandrium_andersonii.AAC.1